MVYKTRKILALFLSVLYFTSPLLSNIRITAFASETSNTDSETVTVNNDTVTAKDTSVSDVIPNYEQLELKALVSKSDIDKLGHVKRMHEEEKSLNSTTYANKDGTTTTYYFMHPVKYVDSNGDIKDIKLELKEDSKGNYISAQSDVIATFPKRLEEGITLKKDKEDVNISMYLQRDTNTLSTVKSERTKSDSNRVEYTYDSDTSVQYELTYTGIKENIIVNQYTGQTEYSFIIKTNGLELVKNGHTYSLVDEEKNVKAVIGDVIIYTADNNNNMIGTMSAETVKDNEIYIITIHLDEEFLKSKDTAYPIIIDPTIEINSNSASSAISDVAIFSEAASNGNSAFLYAGRHDTNGKARFLMKFPGLDLSGANAADRITNATLKLKDIVQNDTSTTVACYVFGGSIWEESNASLSLCTTGAIKAQLSTNVISSSNGVNKIPAHTYSYNITKAVKGWRAGNLNPNKGLIFKTFSSVENGTANNMKAFASYERSDGKPTLVVTYNSTGTLPLAEDTIYLNNWQSGEYLGYFDGTIGAQSGLLSSIGTRTKWMLRKVDGGYVLRPTYASASYLAVPEDTSSIAVETVSVVDEDIPQRCIWEITKIADGKITIKNTYNGNYLFDNGTYVRTSPYIDGYGEEVYRKRVWRYVSASDYISAYGGIYSELDSGFSINTCSLFSGGNIIPTVKSSRVNLLWTDASDFIYTGYSSVQLSYDSLSGKFTSLSTSSNMYSTQITATHKVSGRSETFTLVVNPKAQFVGVVPIESNIERNSWFSPAGSSLRTQGISSIDAEYDTFTVGEILEKLNNDNNYIFVSRSHGVCVVDDDNNLKYTGITIKEDPDEDDGIGEAIHFSKHNIYDDMDLSNMGLVIFAGCNTALDGPYGDSLPKTVVYRGAKAAIGFDETIDCEDGNIFVENILCLLNENCTVYEAMETAKKMSVYKHIGIQSAKMFGKRNYNVF